MKIFYSLFLILFFSACHEAEKPAAALVFQTDFGLKDGAVSAMKGVAMDVDPHLRLFDLTHEIPAFDTWQAGYRLFQTAEYWPAKTVFVSVVDPGVGTERKSIVLHTKNDQYFVGPDNGTFTLIAESGGVAGVREIDEKLNRRKGSEKSYTFHGRDVYAYTGARLAAGAISFEEVGPVLPGDIVRFTYQKPEISGDTINGNIPVLDVQYGNVWTNINDTLLAKMKLQIGDSLNVRIIRDGVERKSFRAPYVRSFGDVNPGAPLVYVNSLLNLSFALNEASLADSFKVGSGTGWRVQAWKHLHKP